MLDSLMAFRLGSFMVRCSYLKLIVGCFCSLLGLFALSVWQCTASEEAGLPCFNFLQPLMDHVVAWSVFPRAMRVVFFTRLMAIVGGIIGFIGLLSFLLRRVRTGVASLAILCALAGETLVLLSYPVWMALSATGVALVVVTLLMGRLPASGQDELAHVPPPRTWEVYAFIPFAIVFILVHFYLLNRIPATWDTEGCGLRHAFHHSFHGLMLHESGMHPISTAGFSWNFVFWLMGHVDEPDLYYLFTRYLSTGITALKFLVMFLLLRRMSGSFPAFLGMGILGFGPPEDWWSREPFLHQLPGLLALLIIWATMRAFDRRRYRDFLLLTFLDAISRFFYPSVLFFGFMPIAFFMTLLVFRWHEWKRHTPKILLLFFAVLFWASWRTIARGVVTGYWAWLPPIEVPSHTRLPTTLWEKLSQIFFRNGLDVVTAIFGHQVNPTHWTVPLTWGVSRSTTSIVVSLVIVALARIVRGRSGAVGFLLLLSLLWAIFPGLMTPVADRRIGVVFCILILIAAREAGYLASVMQADGWRSLSRFVKVVLPTGLALYLAWIGSSVHFEHRGGTPQQVVRGQMFRPFLEDDALVFYVTGDGKCDVFSSLYRDLLSRDCRSGWTSTTYATAPEMESMLANPTLSADMWAYRETGLSKCIEEHKSRSWRKIIFLFADVPNVEATIAQVQNLHPGGVLEQRFHTLETGVVIRTFVYKVTK
jgi:hypothetical protein